MDRLRGKVALITGASSGIGLATARRFLAEGAVVAASDVAPPDPALPAQLHLQLDVTDEAGWSDAVRATETRLGRLDVLVNNAGIGFRSELEAMSVADWRRVMSVNLDGVFLGIKHAAPALRRGGGGCIVNVASMLGSVAVAGTAAYCAAKSGVLGLTRAAALELARDGIRVSAVQPGYVETPLLASRFAQIPGFREQLEHATPAGRLATAEEIASAIVYLASDEAGFLTGSGLVIDGGYTAR